MLIKKSLPEKRLSKSILVPEDQVDLIARECRGDVAWEVGQHAGH